jgi:hypothetical protein
MKKELLEHSLDSVRKYRREKFKAECKPLRKQERLFADEHGVYITTNGYQWSGFAVTEDEAKQVVAAISEAFGWKQGVWNDN